MSQSVPQYTILECSRKQLADESTDPTKHSWKNDMGTFQINKGDVISLENSFINCLGAESTLIELTGIEDQNQIIDTQAGLEYAFYLTNTGQYSVRLPLIRMKFDSGNHTDELTYDISNLKNRCVGRLLPRENNPAQAPQEPLTYNPPVGTIPLGRGGWNNGKQNNNSAQVGEIKKLFYNYDYEGEFIEIRVLETGTDETPDASGNSDIRYNVITKYIPTYMEYNVDSQGNSLMKEGVYGVGDETNGGLQIEVLDVPNPNFCSKYYKGTDGGRYYFPDISYTGWGWNPDVNQADGAFQPRTGEIDLNLKSGFIDPPALANEITNAFNQPEKIKDGNEFCDITPYRLIESTGRQEAKIAYIDNPTFIETKSYKMMPTNFHSDMYPGNYDYTTYVNQMREMYYNIGYKDINRVKGFTPFLSLPFYDDEIDDRNQFYSGLNPVSHMGDEKDQEVGDYGLNIVNQTTFGICVDAEGNNLIYAPNQYSLLLTNMYYTEDNLEKLSRAFRLNETYDGSQTISNTSSTDFNNNCVVEIDVGRYDDQFSNPILNNNYPPTDTNHQESSKNQRTMFTTFLHAEDTPRQNQIYNQGYKIPSRLNYPDKAIRVDPQTNKSYVYTYTDEDKSYNCLPELKVFSRWRDEFEYSQSSPIQYQEFLDNHGVDFTSYQSHILTEDVPLNKLRSKTTSSVSIGDPSISAITAGFPTSGSFILGQEIVTYSGTTPGSFLNTVVTNNYPLGEIIYPAQVIKLDDNGDVIVGRSIHSKQVVVQGDTEILDVQNQPTLNNELIKSNIVMVNEGTQPVFYDNSTSTKDYEFLPIAPLVSGSGATNRFENVQSSGGFIYPNGSGINTYTVTPVGLYPNMYTDFYEVPITPDDAILTYNPNIFNINNYQKKVLENDLATLIQKLPGTGNSATIRIEEVGSLDGQVYETNTGISTTSNLLQYGLLIDSWYSNNEIVELSTGEGSLQLSTGIRGLNPDLFKNTIVFKGGFEYRLGDSVGVSGANEGQSGLAKGIIVDATPNNVRVQLRDLGYDYSATETELKLVSNNPIDEQGTIFYNDIVDESEIYVLFNTTDFPEIGAKIYGSGLHPQNLTTIRNIFFDPVDFPLTSRGTGYVYNESLTGTVLSSGTGFSGRVTAVSNTGEILALSILEEGLGYDDLELIDLTGSVSGANNAVGKITTNQDFFQVTKIEPITNYPRIVMTAQYTRSGSTDIRMDALSGTDNLKLNGMFITSSESGVFQDLTKILFAVKTGSGHMVVKVDKPILQDLVQGRPCFASLYSPLDPESDRKKIIGLNLPANPGDGQTVYFVKNNVGFGGYAKFGLANNLVDAGIPTGIISIPDAGHGYKVNDDIDLKYSQDYPRSDIPWSRPPNVTITAVSSTQGYPIKTKDTLEQNGHNYDVAVQDECTLQVGGDDVGDIRILTNTVDESNGGKITVRTSQDVFPYGASFLSTVSTHLIGDLFEIVQVTPITNATNAVARVTAVTGGQITSADIIESGSGYHNGTPDADFNYNIISGSGSNWTDTRTNFLVSSTNYGRVLSSSLSSDSYGTLNGGGYNLTDIYGLKEDPAYPLVTGQSGYDVSVTALQSARGFPHKLISQTPLTSGTGYISVGLYYLQDTSVTGNTGNSIYVSEVSGSRTPCHVTISRPFLSTAFKGIRIEITSTTHSYLYTDNTSSTFTSGDNRNTYEEQIKLAKKYNLAVVPVNANSEFFEFIFPVSMPSFIALVLKDTFGEPGDGHNTLVENFLRVGQRILYDPSIVRNDAICAYNLQNRGIDIIKGKDIADHPNLMYQGSTKINCEYDADLDRFNFSNFATLTTISNGIQGYANQKDQSSNPDATVAIINGVGQICSEAPYYIDGQDSFPITADEYINNGPEIRQNSRDIITSQSGIAINRVIVYKNGVKTYLTDASNSEDRINYQNSLFSKLGFQLEQFLPIIGSNDGTFVNKIKVQNITYQDAYNQPKPLTFGGFYSSSEVQASSTNSNRDLMYDLGIQIGFEVEPQIQSDTFRGFDIPAKFDSSHFVVYSDIMKGNTNMNYYTKFEDQNSQIQNVNAIGYIEGFNVAGNYITGGGMDFSYVATQSYTLSDINTYILNGKGRTPILGPNSSILYKIQRNVELLEQIPLPVPVPKRKSNKNDKKPKPLRS